MSQNNRLSIFRHIGELTLSSKLKRSNSRHFNMITKRRYTAALKKDSKYRNFYHLTIFPISMLAKKMQSSRKDTSHCIPNLWMFPWVIPVINLSESMTIPKKRSLLAYRKANFKQRERQEKGKDRRSFQWDHYHRTSNCALISIPCLKRKNAIR